VIHGAFAGVGYASPGTRNPPSATCTSSEIEYCIDSFIDSVIFPPPTSAAFAAAMSIARSRSH
jgi:hypothetical protein